MIGSMLQAFQSVILLMILTRTVGLIQSGIFVIAYANANLFLNIGKYGVRYYQVSDVRGQYSFREYCYSRGITVAVMMLISIIYIICAAISNDYSAEKTGIIFWMCLYKATDAIEDVFLGNYQQHERLDIASKVLAVRTAFTILIYALGLFIFCNQLIALCITTVFAYGLMIVFLIWTYEPFKGTGGAKHNRQIFQLLKTCFPLFIGTFLSFYIGNAPKYAIDAQLSDELQACYGFVSMPVFVIGLLNNFIFNPILYKMAIYWREKKISVFLRRIYIQTGIIALITIVCMAGAWILGIPVLSWMYNTDLAPYKSELLILLVGGGFLGLSGFLNAMITTIRFQQSMAFGYGLVAILAFFLSTPIVRMYGILGASVLYTMLMGGLSICFWGLLMWGIKKR